MSPPGPERATGRLRTRREGGRYSRFVELMRVLLPATALALVGLVVLWPHLTGGYTGLIMPTLSSQEVARADVMRMHEPRYVGRTDSAEPYEVTAATAFLDPGRPNLIRLDRLAADIATTGRRDLKLAALHGLYNRASEKLDLNGDVELLTSDGYRFETQSALINLKAGRVQGAEPIAGSGPAGTLEADRFEILDGGDRLRFQGRVKVTVRPQPPAAGAAP